MRFADRADAGRRLAQALARYRDRDPIVLALPRGGLPLAAEIAEALAAPLDVVLARKIGVPGQPELAMGALAEGDDAPIVVRNEAVIRACGIDEQAFAAATERARAELDDARRRLIGGRRRAAFAGRAAILVDDGVATGATALAALRSIRRRGAQTLILAAPVASPEALATLRSEVDDLVCLAAPAHFAAVSAFYDVFPQVEDEQAIAVLARFSAGAD